MENFVQPASSPGFILLDDSLQPVAFNPAALQILAYPTEPERIRSPAQFIRDRILHWLHKAEAGPEGTFVQDFLSGRRTYACRSFYMNTGSSRSPQVTLAVLLERTGYHTSALAELMGRFRLTPRESQLVALLVEGLTTKEVATRMNISPNTVKAFLRTIMFKMDVTTRSGIVGKVLLSMPSAGEKSLHGVQGPLSLDVD